MTQEQFNMEKRFNFSKSTFDNCKPLFNVLSEGKRVNVTSEQATASLFTNMLKILKLNNIESNDFVVSVPSYFTATER